jgi:tetraacyldisaccharide 4'-kinase
MKPLVEQSGDYYRYVVSGMARGLGPGILRAGLWAASVPYSWATRWRNRLYDRGWKTSRRAPVPVVSIGNLTLGGTGKTPCVEYVARFYRDLGKRVAILSRGYGGNGTANDEALLLRENLPDVPHYQAADRVALAAQAVNESGSEVLVLDDGFQHRRLARDLDIVLVDASQPWGHGHLFPRGLLREGPRSLRRAGLIVLTRCDQVTPMERRRLTEQITRHAPRASVVETVHRPLELINSARGAADRTASLSLAVGRPMAAFCGIGNPGAFRHTLHSLGAVVTAFRAFPDHHAYTRGDVEALTTWAREQARDGIVLTTQKDLVKLHVTEFGGRDLWALRIGLHVENGQGTLDGQLRLVIQRE